MTKKNQPSYPCLNVPDAKGKTRRIPIKKREVTVGRDPSNDICIDDHLVSKFHARILVANQSVTVIDLDSANKTRLNGKIVTQATVRFGDELRFARVVCRLVLPETAPRSSSKIV